MLYPKKSKLSVEGISNIKLKAIEKSVDNWLITSDGKSDQKPDWEGVVRQHDAIPIYSIKNILNNRWIYWPSDLKKIKTMLQTFADSALLINSVRNEIIQRKNKNQALKDPFKEIQKINFKQ